jgi:hypothetical protein
VRKYKVSGLEFGVWGLEFGVWSLEFGAFTKDKVVDLVRICDLGLAEDYDFKAARNSVFQCFALRWLLMNVFYDGPSILTAISFRCVTHFGVL